MIWYISEFSATWHELGLGINSRIPMDCQGVPKIGILVWNPILCQKSPYTMIRGKWGIKIQVIKYTVFKLSIVPDGSQYLKNLVEYQYDVSIGGMSEILDSN